MLIWIKVYRFAIGVLVIFAVLLSTVVSGNLTNSTEESVTPASEYRELDSVELAQLPFASTLINPCSWVAVPNKPSISIEGHRASFAVEFYRFVSLFANEYKEEARKLLLKHVISDCMTLHISNLPNTPTLEELKEMDTEDALNSIYSSLLLHSAYAYFINHQFHSNNIICSQDIIGERDLADETLTFAIKEKSLACSVRIGITVLGYEIKDTSPLLQEKFSLLTQCSRRALRDCQVLNSSFKLLKAVADYAAAAVS